MENTDVGKIIVDLGAVERDAVHIAVYPVVAEHALSVGQPVTLNSAGKYAKGVAEDWLRDYAHTVGINFYELVDVAERNTDDEYLHFGTDAYGIIDPEFWNYLESYIQKTIPINRRAGRFSCSC